jgi:hypothetical protein
MGLLWLEKRGYLAIPEDLVRSEGVGANASKAIGDRTQKITLAEMREMGVRGVLVYCSDCRCG